MTRSWVLAGPVVLWAAVALGAVQESPIQSFLYQTRDVDLVAIAESGYRAVILDPSRDGTPAGDWTPAEIAQLKQAGKIVLALVRVGEADSLRSYWNPLWQDPESGVPAPSWLGPEDTERPGIFRVRYWEAGWQDVLLGGTAPYIDSVLAQGFDGLVLAGVDAHEYWGPDGRLPSAQRNPTARADMVALVSAIAGHARALAGDPALWMLALNGATLAADDAYLSSISGILAESTWFVGSKRQKTRQTRAVVPYLDRILEVGKVVLVVDYTSIDRDVDTFYDRAESKGYVPLAAAAELNSIPQHARHPPGLPVSFTPADPPQFDDIYPNSIPTFTWSDGGLGALAFRIRFSGSDSRQQVLTFPKSGVLSTTQFTPKAWEWRSILRRSRDNNGGRIYWWITTEDPGAGVRSSRAQILHRMHPNVATTIFWVGAEKGQSGPESRVASAWDAEWVSHFGGVDDPFNRSPLNPYWPLGFTPLENPFYVALPYNDFAPTGVRRPNAAAVVPWARLREYGPLDSMVKNRWVKIVNAGRVCYAQWEDVGPFQNHDFRYVFGSNKPRNKQNLGAGLEVSPALARCLDLIGIAATSWRFVFDDETLPDGPWAEIVTTSPITPPPGVDAAGSELQNVR